ncbi:MAG: glycosyltransferase family 2 protein [Verrucomicrobium sp.]|nr:glycosyltransferase family 2 protein [Verrucomicrobium sp.]
MRVGIFWPLFGAVLALMVAGIVLGLVSVGPAAWLIGFSYIAYDSWILGRMVWGSWRLPRREGVPAGSRLTVTVVVCARNERVILPSCLESLAAQDEPAEEIIVLDDGSTDGTAAWMAAAWPGLRLVSQPHSGKAAALNRGWRAAREELVLTLDADTRPEPGALRAVRDAFAADPALTAAGGVLFPHCRPAPGGQLFAFFQKFEYLRSYLWRAVWARGEMLLLVSGAFAIYRREALEALGGFDAKSWVEDYDLVYRLYRHAGDRGLPWKVGVVAGARAVTDAPAAFRPFLHQRTRWFAGFLDTLFQAREMVGNGRYGAMGRRMLPMKVVDTLLPLYALLALLLLAYLLLSGSAWSGPILAVLLAKFLYDILLHAAAIGLFQRWQGLPQSPALWFQALAATVTEPFFFQILRHLGAFLGWIAFLRRRVHWTPQREVSTGNP